MKTAISTTTRCARPWPRSTAQDDHRRCIRLSARHRLCKDFAKSRTRSAHICMVDMAHIAGLVAAGLHPSPVPVCGRCHHHHPQDAARPARRHDSLQRRGDWQRRSTRPSSPARRAARSMHVIAAKAVCFGEALKPEFKAYQQQSRHQRQACWQTHSMKQGFDLVSGGTDNHLMLIDLRNDRRDRQGAAAPSGRGVHHRQQECHPERPGKSVRHLAACASARPLSPPAASVRRRCSALPSSSGRPQPISTTRQTISAEMYAISAQIFQFTNNICRLPTVGVGFFVGFVRFA